MTIARFKWRWARVNIDYHVEADGHYYSVPYTLVKQQVEVRLTATTVEVLHRGEPRGEPSALLGARLAYDASGAHAQGACGSC